MGTVQCCVSVLTLWSSTFPIIMCMLTRNTAVLWPEGCCGSMDAVKQRHDTEARFLFCHPSIPPSMFHVPWVPETKPSPPQSLESVPGLTPLCMYFADQVCLQVLFLWMLGFPSSWLWFLARWTTHGLFLLISH